MKRHTQIRWLAPAILGLLLATPALSWAQDDLDVTMRMVADDQELDDSFVQQLELPQSVDAPAGTNGFGDMQTDSGDFASDTREDMQEFARNLWKTRATRMGLEIEEPSEETEVEVIEPTEKEADTSA